MFFFPPYSEMHCETDKKLFLHRSVFLINEAESAV